MSGQNKQEAEGRSAAGGGDTGAQATQASAVDSTRPDGDTQPLEVDLTQPPRLRGADRRQLLSPMTIDDLLPPDHPARSVWRFVEEMDLSELYDLVRARGSRAGRPAIDPRVLVALWLYATLAGVTSARALADLCQHHDAYFWLAGGIPVNAHTLSDFRIDHPAFLQHLLEHSVNALRQQGLTDLDRVAQDGMRVRASAGAASFRSKETLEKRLKEAEAKLQALQQQMAGKEQPAAPQQPASQEPVAPPAAAEPAPPEEAAKQEPSAQQPVAAQAASQQTQTASEASVDTADLVDRQEVKAADQPAARTEATQQARASQGPASESAVVGSCGRRHAQASQEATTEQRGLSAKQRAARWRAAKETVERYRHALGRMPEMEAKKAAQQKKAGKKESGKQGKKDKARVSSTDFEATVMKMADGGFRPAYNVEYSTACKGMVIGGVEVVTEGTDQGQLPPMLDQIEGRFGERPKQALVDGGLGNHQDIEKVQGAKKGCKVYAPVPKPKKEGVDRFKPKKTDGKQTAEWRQRMSTDKAKEIYKLRGATAECVNAHARNRGLQQLRVRGTPKVKSVGLWFAAVHNMARAFSLLPHPDA